MSTKNKDKKSSSKSSKPAKGDSKKVDAKKVSKKVEAKSSKKDKGSKKAPKAPKITPLSQEQADDLTSKLFRIAKKIKAAGSDKEKKPLFAKASGYLDKVDFASKKGMFPKLDKAYNRTFDRLPKELQKAS